jgi:hypothetical protein
MSAGSVDFPVEALVALLLRGARRPMVLPRRVAMGHIGD